MKLCNATTRVTDTECVHGRAPTADVDRGTKILVVDDDVITRSLTRDALDDAGFHVVEADNGADALAMFETERPALLILDAVMPIMDGFECCRILRSQPESRHVPILMATGLDDDRSVEQAYDAGATDFIAKPLNWIVLTQRLRYILRASRAFADLHANQQHLIAAKEAAEAANQAKSEFLATMGHELKTPLNAIIGFSTILRDGQMGPIDETYAEYAGLIANSGEHLLANINDILDFARAETGRLALDERPVDIAATVEYCVRIAMETDSNGGVEFTSAIDPNVPLLRADPRRLKQIFSNLLSNAGNFTPSGGSVTITVQRREDGLAIQVSDTGIGIPPDKLTKALSPFGQADSKLSREYEGFGIGLPLTDRLVALHDGRLDLASTPGMGTTVTLSFPESRVVVAANAAEVVSV